jgi:O-antigen ligase
MADDSLEPDVHDGPMAASGRSVERRCGRDSDRPLRASDKSVGPYRQWLRVFSCSMIPRCSFAILGGMWVALCLAIVPLAFLIGLTDKVAEVQFSARQRVVIWKATASKAMSRPILGHGLASTQALAASSLQNKNAPLGDARNAEESLDVHAHNIFLQTWDETGGIGAFLLMLSGLPLLFWIWQAETATRPYLAATWAMGGTMSALSWSLIAPWFMAAFGMTIIWTRFADNAAIQPMPLHSDERR